MSTETIQVDAYFTEAGSRHPDAIEPSNGITLGPFPDEATATAAATAVRGWTLGTLADLGLGGIDEYAPGVLAAGRHEVVRWAQVRPAYKIGTDEDGKPLWDLDDAIEVYEIEAVAA